MPEARPGVRFGTDYSARCGGRNGERERSREVRVVSLLASFSSLILPLGESGSRWTCTCHDPFYIYIYIYDSTSLLVSGRLYSALSFILTLADLSYISKRVHKVYYKVYTSRWFRRMISIKVSRMAMKMKLREITCLEIQKSREFCCIRGVLREHCYGIVSFYIIFQLI